MGTKSDYGNEMGWEWEKSWEWKGWESNYYSHTSLFIIYFTRLVTTSVLLPSVLCRCWFGGRKGICPVKPDGWDAGMVICLRRGAECGPADATATDYLLHQ